MREVIFNFFKNTINKAYQDREIGTTYHLDLKNGYSVVLTWEDGYDTKDGYELCVSLRVTNSSYFVFDWEIIEEDWSIEGNNVDYEGITNYIMGLIKGGKDTKRHFKIFYNDGVFAMDVVFTDKDDNFIKSYLQEVIDNDFNTNPNSLYHISFKNIIEVK